jgi:hypothetical protein
MSVFLSEYWTNHGKNPGKLGQQAQKTDNKGRFLSVTDNIRRAEKQTSGQNKCVSGLEDRGFGPMCVQSGR